jgi:hypothetical protein
VSSRAPAPVCGCRETSVEPLREPTARLRPSPSSARERRRLLGLPRRRSQLLEPRRHGRGGGRLLPLPRSARLPQEQRSARRLRGERQPPPRSLRQLYASRPAHPCATLP